MKPIFSIFKVFQHSDEYFEMLSNSNFSRNQVWKQLLVIFIFSFLYGIVMGSFNGYLQSLVTAIKIPCLILLALFICFPAFFVIQYLIGSTMNLFQMANIILSGFLVFCTIILSFAPIVIFFMITGDNYSFLKLLHVAIFAFSGIFMVKAIGKGLMYFCEKKNVYPKIGMNIFAIWIIIFAFVSSQLAWNLRPFVGSRDLPFELFRARKGNFYIAVIQSAGGILKKNETSTANDGKILQQQPDSSINKKNGQ